MIFDKKDKYFYLGIGTVVSFILAMLTMVALLALVVMNFSNAVTSSYTFNDNEKYNIIAFGCQSGNVYLIYGDLSRSKKLNLSVLPNQFNSPITNLYFTEQLSVLFFFISFFIYRLHNLFLSLSQQQIEWVVILSPERVNVLWSLQC